MEGQVVASSDRHPFSARPFIWGSRPRPISSRTVSGSSPSRPMTTTRRALGGRGGRRQRSSRMTSRTGQLSRAKSANKKVLKSRKKEVMKANPAPGPT